MSTSHDPTQGLAELLAHVPRPPAVFEGMTFNASVPPPRELSDTEFRNCTFRSFAWHGAMRGVRFIHCRFEQVAWQGASLADVTWDDCDIADLAWTRCRLDRTVFSGGTAARLAFNQCEVHFATVSGTALTDIRCASTRLVQTVASGARIEGLHVHQGALQDMSLADCHIQGLLAEGVALERFICAQSHCSAATFIDCSGKGVQWVACVLHDMRWKGTQLLQSAWSRSEWTEGTFEECSLQLPSFDGAVLEDVRWLRSPCTRPLFDGARLVRCNLAQQHMPAMSLRGAWLESVDLRGLQAPELDARGVQLHRVDMSKADFTRANLIGQRQLAWATAMVDGAVFEEAVELRDDHWWARHVPGPRNKGHEDAAPPVGR